MNSESTHFFKTRHFAATLKENKIFFAEKIRNAYTVEIGEGSGPRAGTIDLIFGDLGSGPQGPLLGSTTFYNFDGTGVSFGICENMSRTG